jgi:hypothetical protein
MEAPMNGPPQPTSRDPIVHHRDPLIERARKKKRTMKHKKKKQLSEQDKERIACRALADLFERDAAEIAVDPRNTRAESAPLPIVGKLLQGARELRETHDTR